MEVAKLLPADAVEREAWSARHAEPGERDPYAVASARFAAYAVDGHDDAIAAQLKRELDDHGG